eukprot:NODE_416_length_9017_cov_0.133326.p1 type:complete len:1886 gc:universal NODE_416_length_9017_cov_0.133326:185-5842(+)
MNKSNKAMVKDGVKDYGVAKCNATQGRNMGKLKNCFEFQKSNKCTRGDNCGYIHENLKHLVCLELKRSGNCRFNDKCKFSHDLDGEDNNTTTSESKFEKRLNFIYKAGYGWENLKVVTVYRALKEINDLKKISSFVTAFMYIMENHTDKLIRNLYEYMDAIKQVLDRNVSADKAAGLSCFQTTVVPLLGLFCSKKFESSALLGEKIKVFALLEGLVNRFDTTYHDALSCLINNGLDSYWEDGIFRNCNTPMVLSELFYPIFKVLAKIEEHCLNARLNDSDVWTAINKKYISLFKQAEDKHLFDFREEIIVNQIKIMVKRKQGKSTIFTQHNQETITANRSNNPVVPPGKRHDNDFTDFTNIKILPTNEELSSPVVPYLPNNMENGNIGDLSSMAQLLDTQFRLMRWDIVYMLKDAHSSILANAEEILALQQSCYKKYNNVPLFVYTNCKIMNPSVTKQGLSFKVGFDQIETKKKSLADLYEKKFHNGQCYFLLMGKRIFITVVAQSDKDDLISKTPNVILTPLEDKDRLELQDIWVNTSVKMALVELPNISLVGYVSVLQALQELAFSENVILNNISYECDPIVLKQVPDYAISADFRFDLNHLVPGLKLNANNPNETIQVLYRETTLDKTQCEAMVAGLTQKLSLIKGPPGTGKSFTGIKIIDTILKNKACIGTSPVVIIAYTNHALDNFLLGILDANPNVKMIRIGGRSKVEEIQGFELNKLLRENRTKNPIIGKLNNELRQCDERYAQCLNKSSNASKYALFVEMIKILGIDNPFEGQQEFDGWLLFEPDPVSVVTEEEFDVKFENFEDYLIEFDGVPSEYVKNEMFKLCLPLRDVMFDEFTATFKLRNKEEMEQITGRMVELYTQLKDEQSAEKIRFLLQQEFDIIGLTTTGLSGNINLINALAPRIVFCEEAAECLEGHILVALQNSVQQLMLIGDDQQLTPKINNHDLSKHHPRKQHRLDLSMFERLGLLNVKMHTLNVQRRMRTEIAKLTRDVYYPELLDADECATREDIKGFTRNVIFLDHSFPEYSEANKTSHINKKEAEMTLEIVNYLINQEYKPEDITVLTPYLGQMMQLRQIFQNKFIVVIEEQDMAELEDAMLTEDVAPLDPTIERKSMKCIRISTVDNFQGEESKIIVISTVRNTPSKTAGFLTIDNRINVMQSRARDGMIILGSRELLVNGKTANPNWSKIINIISHVGRVSNDLELICQVHGTLNYVSTINDFSAKVPLGGCLKNCGFKMRCGHACSLSCHPKDRAHVAIKCVKDCIRVLQCNHICTKLCHQDCGDCEILLKNFKLPCNHVMNEILCANSTNPKYKCKVPTQVTLACGHLASKKCHLNIKDVKCKEPCKAELECGHYCTGLFHVCEKNTSHVECKETCDQLLNCSHFCTSTCHAKDVPHGLCNKPCFANCSHSTCSKKCSDWCNVCIEKCQDHCKHQLPCELPCGAPCNTPPCNKRCDLKLKCGHLCPTVCGEQCPLMDFCQECGKEDILQRQADDIMMETLKEVDLNKNPIVIFPCHHFRTIESADGLLEMNKYFEDSTGTPLQLANIISFPKCPECRGLIINIPRYARIWKKAMIDYCSHKFKARYQEKTSTLQLCLLNGINKKLKKNELPMDKAQNYYKTNIARIESEIKEINNEDPHLRILETLQDISTIDYLKIRDQKSLNALKELKMMAVSNVFEYLGKHLDKGQSEEVVAFIDKIKTEGIGYYEECKANAVEAKLLFKEFDIDISYIQMLVKHLGVLSKIYPEINDDDVAGVKKEIQLIQLKFNNYAIEMPEKKVFINEKSQSLIECSLAVTSIEQGSYAFILKSVVKAMERENGRPLIFYECPNGHLYTIGECGMAMEESICPTCGATIGGAHHSSATGNRQVGQANQVLQ